MKKLIVVFSLVFIVSITALILAGRNKSSYNDVIIEAKEQSIRDLLINSKYDIDVTNKCINRIQLEIDSLKNNK